MYQLTAVGVSGTISITDTMAGWIVDGLVARAPLRPGIDRSYAIDVVWLLMDPAVFTRLRIDRGWSRRRFQQWFADSTARLLTDHANRARAVSAP